MSDISKYFDESAVFKHINTLAFNRQASTQGEKKAINYIQNELANENIKNKTESFKWYDSNYIELLSLLILFAIVFIVILSYIINTTWIFRIIISLPILLLHLFIPNSYIDLINNLGIKKESRNIIGEINAKNKYFKRPVIIFSAHYESTSKRYSLKVQTFLYFFSFLSLISYFVSALITFTFSILIPSSFNRINLILEIIFEIPWPSMSFSKTGMITSAAFISSPLGR